MWANGKHNVASLGTQSELLVLSIFKELVGGVYVRIFEDCVVKGPVSRGIEQTRYPSGIV